MSKITLGTCSWTNKEHFPVRMYSHSTGGTEVAATEGQWLLSKLPECSAPKPPGNSLEACVHSPYIPSYPMHKHNICDITKWHHDCLLPSSIRKTLHMCRRAMPTCLCTCQCPSQLFFYSYAQTILSILYPKFSKPMTYIYYIWYIP